MKSVTRFILIIAVLIYTALLVMPVKHTKAQSPSLDEEFNSPTLDSAWQLVEFTGTRVYSLTDPANHISLTDNPGHLRYSLDPMTHGDGFLNNFQTTYGFHSCCNHDPGLELRRTFSGEDWLFEAKASYFMPFSNGRNLNLRIYFGDGGANTFFVEFRRWRDGPWPEGTPETQPISIQLFQMTGPSLSDISTLVSDFPTHTPSDTYFYQLERSGGLLTARWSTDGTNWTTAFSEDLGTQLDGLSQRVVISGLSWFNPAGSYADYDYIKVTSNIVFVSYLPIIFKPEPVTGLNVRSINTGDINPLEIRDPNNGNALLLSCTVGNNVTQFCGSFSAIGTYTVIAYTANCGVLQKTFSDAVAGATVTREVICN